jgi:hypothetical protein
MNALPSQIGDFVFVRTSYVRVTRSDRCDRVRENFSRTLYLLKSVNSRSQELLTNAFPVQTGESVFARTSHERYTCSNR